MKIGALHLARHVVGERQHRRVVAARFIEAGDQMRAAGTGGAGTHRELSGELGLTGGSQRRSFFMTDANPFDAASSNRVGERIQGVADQREYMLDPDLLEHADEEIRNGLRHLPLR